MSRDRNEDGRYRQKRGDTHVGTIEKAYGVDFGVRSDMQFGHPPATCRRDQS